MDKRTVFADSLILARALKVLDHGVLVGEPPNALADARHERRPEDGHEGAGHRPLRPARGGVEQTPTSFYWGARQLDAHRRTSDIYLRLKDGKFEVQPTLSRGEWGVDARTTPGRIYRNTNESALHVDFVPTPYFARNPEPAPHARQLRSAARRRTTLSTSSGRSGRTRARTARIRPASIAPDGTLARFTSVCAPLVYRGDRLPAELYGNVFVAEPAANLVSRIVLSDDGTTLRARKAYEQRRVPGLHRRALPAGLPLQRARRHALHRRHVSRRDPAARSTSPSTCATTSVAQAGAADRPGPDLSRRARDDAARHASDACANATPAQLVEALSHPNGWWRDTAQRLLVERGDKSVVPALVKLAGARQGSGGRGCTRCGRSTASTRIEPATVTKALEDPSRDVRVVGDPHRGALARRRRTSDPGGGAEAAGRPGLGGAAAARGVARRAAGRAARDARSWRCSSGTATIRSSWTRR